MFESHGADAGSVEPSAVTAGTPDAPAAELAQTQIAQAQLAQAGPAGEPIGAVEELTGDVVLTHADGSTSTAAPGEPVYLNDVVTTPTGGSIEIRFVDGTRFSLGQDGEMTLDQLVYNPGGGGNELDLSVAQGAFTFVTGAIAGAPGEGMEVHVPVGTIGIRGTAVGGGPAYATADPTDYTIVLLPEPGGRVGRIVLTDLNGRSVILDDALEAMDISALGLAPGEPVQLTREQVIALLGQAIENIEDILDEVENFEPEDSPEDDANPEAGPQQEGQLFNTVPNNGGIRTLLGETLTLGELTSLFTLSDEQGFNRGPNGPINGFTPVGGLGDNDPGPQNGLPNDSGPNQGVDPIPGENPPPSSGFVVLTGGDGDDILDASTFTGPTSITGNGGNDTLIGSAFDDILDGGAGDDVLDAGAGNDQVNGGAGDDVIVGGSGQGNDTLDGGAGNDWVLYSSAIQPITVNLTAGVAYGDPAIGTDTLSNIENVVGGQGNDVIIGNSQDNILVGGEGGDTLTGLGGDDTIIGGGGNDVAVFTGNRNNYTIESTQGGFFITDNRQGPQNDGTDFIAADVEVLRFADGDVAVAPLAVGDGDVISEAQQSVGNVLSNDAVGGGAVNIASLGYGGNLDEVSATAVGSIITYAALDGSWRMDFNLSTGGYTFTVLEGLDHSDSSSLSFPFTYTLVGITGATSSATLTIVVTDGVPNAVADSATATEGGAEIGGNVLANDGVGPDGAWVSSIIIDGETYVVPGGEPRVIGTPLGGVLTIWADGQWIYAPPDELASSGAGSESFTYTITDGDGDTSSAVLQVTVQQGSGTIDGTPGDDYFLEGTSGNDHIRGFAGNDTLTGLEGDDILEGGDDTDLLFGGDGNDSLYGGKGTDILRGGAGNDLLDGGEGVDIADYSEAADGIDVDLSAGVATNDGDNGSDVLVDIEHVNGSMFADVIRGNDENNVLIGNDGDDALYGGAGDDVLASGQGYDYVDGGDGSDFVSYADSETGVVVDLAEGRAWKADFTDDELVNIENVIGSADDDQIYGDDGANTIIGGGGADVIDGRGGDDLFIVENEEELSALEVLNGGDGIDTLLIGGEGAIIDLSMSYAISNIERIDISGVGVNSVMLTVDDVLEKFGGVLEIVGDSDDSVTSVGQDWAFVGQETRQDGIVFNHYAAADGTVSLYVSEAISPDAIS